MKDKELKEKFIDEKTGIEYIKQGDYYVPNLILKGTEKEINLGKYGRMRLRFLKEHKKAEYTILLMNNELQNHLIDIDKTARNRVDLLIKQFAKQENITEELKAENQLQWVGMMNNCQNRAEEIVLKELIYI